ncbi:MAG: glycosyltransferase family 39 protein [Patescibacteria group bacterium]
MKIMLKKPGNWLIVGLLALIFFVLTSSFNYLTQDENYTKWSSPDETANYFFAKQFATSGELAFFDEANIISSDWVTPRSMRSDAGSVKPVSFLGIILIYGLIGAGLGVGIIPFLTPFFAALGILIFYGAVKRLFGERVGLWSSFLLTFFPVYIYYTVRSLFHNVLFIVLLLAGIYLFLAALGPKREKGERRPKRELFAAFFSGLAVGLALITRTSEILWLAPVLFLVWIFYVRRFGLIKLILFAAGLFTGLLPSAYYNQILYSSFFHGGYNEMNRTFDDLTKKSGELFKSTWQGRFYYYRDYLAALFKNIFYFGFNYEQSVLTAKNYIVKMFPALFYAGAAGLVVLIGQNIRRFKKKYLVYLLAGLTAGVFLIFYYGSWKFNDNPDLTRFTIGNSYTRYWLPIYLWLMPLAALALVKVTEAALAWPAKIRETGQEIVARARRLAALGLQILPIAIWSALSLLFVLYGSEEGLAYLYYNNKYERVQMAEVLALTEPDSIIITRYHDKFLFPERRVLVGSLPDDGVATAAAKLLPYYPVYYYNFYLDEPAVQYLNERKLVDYQIEMQLMRKKEKFGLYRLELKETIGLATSTTAIGTSSSSILTPFNSEKNE